MGQYPLLPLPAPERGDPPTGRGVPRNNVPSLSPQRQAQRLGPVFQRLVDVFADGRDDVTLLRSDPSSIAPERALVLEVAGSQVDFQAVVRRVGGLEFLGDEEMIFDPDKDFSVPDTRKGREGQQRMNRLLDGRLYLSMPDTAALKQLLSLWKHWQDRKSLPWGFTKWQDIFAMLRNIRPWGAADRLSQETISQWQAMIDKDPGRMQRIEVEMWFREDQENRTIAYRRVKKAVDQAGGTVIDHAVIEAVGYEAVLIDVPSEEITRLAERKEVHLLCCDDIMFLRLQSFIDVPGPGEGLEAEVEIPKTKTDALPPIAALLDGVPVQNHTLLAGRLDVDDPDDLEPMSVVAERRHGTAMASLIVHGDRNLVNQALSRPLHVRPVLCALGSGERECPRRDRLLIDVIYQAVRRMKEGDERSEATAAEVFLVNLSLGDLSRPFSGSISPWARLLDYLAERYGILFLVSAGNIREPLPISGFTSGIQFEDAEPRERERKVLYALSAQKAFRTLLSPAEALNPITVGAMHNDAVDGPRGASAVDPYHTHHLPNVSSALGLGHRKVVKPDIHLPGGREHLQPQDSRETLLVVPKQNRAGLRAASPDGAGNLDRTRLIMGTSAATALATRAAHLIFDALVDRDAGPMGADFEPKFRGVVIKALLIHRARWGSRADFLDGNQGPGPHNRGQHNEKRDNIARLLGFGFPEVEEALSCASNRATLVGYGIISAREANIHRIPLPQSLENVKEPRSLAVTVAWFSPVNRRHKAYRQAKLDVTPLRKFEDAAGVKRLSKQQPASPSIQRGTVFHTHYAGNRAVSFFDDGHVVLRISCLAQAGGLDQSIRYGIAVTIEAGEDIPVYEEVRARLSAPRIQP